MNSPDNIHSIDGHPRGRGSSGAGGASPHPPTDPDPAPQYRVPWAAVGAISAVVAAVIAIVGVPVAVTIGMNSQLSSHVSSVNDNVNQLRSDVDRQHQRLGMEIDRFGHDVEDALDRMNDLAVDVGRIEGQLAPAAFPTNPP